MRNAFFYLFLLAPLGCGTVDSSTLATSDIEASIRVDLVSPDDAEVNVFLYDGFKNVVLSDGDRLVGQTGAGDDLAFELNSVDFYEAPVSFDVGEVTVALERDNETSAPASSGVVPPPLTFDAPLDGSTVSVAEGDLTITWSNAIAGAEVLVVPRACGGASLAVGDDLWESDAGSVVIPASTLRGSDCLSVNFVRRLRGAVDPAFHPDSRFEARREEEHDITVVP